jgi:hypothetical protein
MNQLGRSLLNLPQFKPIDNDSFIFMLFYNMLLTA